MKVSRTCGYLVLLFCSLQSLFCSVNVLEGTRIGDGQIKNKSIFNFSFHRNPRPVILLPSLLPPTPSQLGTTVATQLSALAVTFLINKPTTIPYIYSISSTPPRCRRRIPPTIHSNFYPPGIPDIYIHKIADAPYRLASESGPMQCTVCRSKSGRCNIQHEHRHRVFISADVHADAL